MTGTLSLLGTPPLAIPAGAAPGSVLTSDAGGNVAWAPPSAAIFDVAAHNPAGDARQVTGGAMTAASAVLTCTSAHPFAAPDTGKVIVVQGAGAAGGDLVTTITAYTSSTQVTLAAAAGTTVSAATVTFGTDDTAALQAAVSAAFAFGGAAVHIPACSGYLTTASVSGTGVGNGMKVYGDGNGTVIYPTGNYDALSFTNGTGLTVSDLQIQGALSAPTAGAALLIASVADYRVINVSAYGCFYGEHTTGGTSKTANNTNCYFDGYAYGAYIKGSFTSIGCHYEGGAIGICLDSASGHSVRMFRTGLYGPLPLTTRSTDNLSSLISNKTVWLVGVECNYQAGLGAGATAFFTGTEAPGGMNLDWCAGDVHIVSCWLAGSGLTIGGNVAPTWVEITGGVYSGNTPTLQNGIHLKAGKEITITGAHLTGSADHTLYDDILIDSAVQGPVTISGCEFSGSSFYNINSAVTSGPVTITGNSFSGFSAPVPVNYPAASAAHTVSGNGGMASWSPLAPAFTAPAPSGGDDYAAIAPLWSAAMAAGVPFQFLEGKYKFSQPLPAITVSGWMVLGAGKNGASSDKGTLLQAETGASLSNWPQGAGIITTTALTTTIRDMSFDGNSVAFSELAMSHAEFTCRHLFAGLEFRNNSIGPGLWNVGCEDVTWHKCEISGSEAPASVGLQSLGAWISSPGGQQNASGCDFFAPVAVNAADWTHTGGNAGNLLVCNPGGDQSRHVTVTGCWIYDGTGYSGQATVFSPVDAVIGAPADAAMGASGTTLTTTTAYFTSAMTGSAIAVYPPGAAAPLTGTISAFTSSTQVTTSFTNTGAAFSGAFWWAAAGFLGNVTIRASRMVSALSANWVHGWLPNGNEVTLDDHTVLAATSLNANNPLIIFRIPSGGSGTNTSCRIGHGGVQINTSGSAHVQIGSGGSTTHTYETLGIISGYPTTLIGQTNLTLAPAVPASGTPFVNPYPQQMAVRLTGGTVSAVTVNGTAPPGVYAKFILPASGTVTLTYSVAPTWTWNQLVTIPVIDTTAADIVPDGTQAAGATGFAADAGHVHPTGNQAGTAASRPSASSVAPGTFYFSTDTTALWRSDGANWALVNFDPNYLLNGQHPYREPYSRALSFTSAAVLTSGVATFVAVPCYAGDVITSIAFCAGATGLTMGSNADGHMWFALYDTTVTLMSQTADQGGAATWALNSAKDLALSTNGGAQTIATTGVYYAAIMVSAGTGGAPAVPLLRGTGASTSNLAGSFITGMKQLAGTNGSALGASAAAGPLSLTSGSLIPYCALH